MSKLADALREMTEINAALFRAISAESEVVQTGILDRLEAEQKKLGISDGYGTRARAALAADGWQPIEPAPRDGTTICLWWDHKRRLARFIAADGPFGPFANWVPEDRGAIPLTIAPTHWKPLPAHPQEKP